MENNCDWSVTFNRVFSVNLSNRTKTKSRVKCTLKIDSISINLIQFLNFLMVDSFIPTWFPITQSSLTYTYSILKKIKTKSNAKKHSTCKPCLPSFQPLKFVKPAEWDIMCGCDENILRYLNIYLNKLQLKVLKLEVNKSWRY